MSAKRRRTERDKRRRTHGQNFLADQDEVNRIVDAAQIEPGEMVVEIGAGSGTMTLPLARTGARVIAIETDPLWVDQLRERVDDSGLDDRVDVIQDDFRSIRLPGQPYRVVSNPPFGLTTALFEKLFDRPSAGPWRADLLVQYEVARKRAATPPTTLRSSAWAPWWEFKLGPTVPARAFRPMPTVDAALLTVRRRDRPVLADWLSPVLRDLLRPGWHPPSTGF